MSYVTTKSVSTIKKLPEVNIYTKEHIKRQNNTIQDTIFNNCSLSMTDKFGDEHLKFVN